MISLHINFNTLEKSASGLITSVVYFKIKDKVFPEEGWNDFTIAILNFWLSEIIKMRQKKKRKGKFYFMDGPIYFTIEKNTETSVFEGYRNDKRIITKQIDFEEFTDTILSNSKNILDEMETRNWSSSDIESLKNNINSEL
jgi:hypothetical protein